MPVSAAKVMALIWHRKKYNNYGKKYSTDNFTAYWAIEVEDRKPSDPVLVFCHGGGYVFPLSLPQIWLLTKIAKTFPEKRLSILIMDYSLSPENKYPKQIHEIAALYHNLVDVEGCDNIVLIGESCGGNLVLALLAHLKHGFPTATQIISKNRVSAIKALILISPWVNLSVPADVDDENSSYVKNAKEDILTTERLNYWASQYCPDEIARQMSPWVSPMMLTEDNMDFWDDALPKKSLVTWGEDEVMRDDSSKWAKEIAKVSDAFEAPHGIHVDVLFEDKSSVFEKIVEFLGSVFGDEGVEAVDEFRSGSFDSHGRGLDPATDENSPSSSLSPASK